MTDTLHTEAVVGRRVEFAYYRDKDTYLPGIITRITDDPASLRVRLDGARSNLAVPADYEGIRYLNEVVPVPALPMGRFHPTVADFDGSLYAGVPACEFEDGDIVILTADPETARAALPEYCKAMDMDPDYVDLALNQLNPRWVVFEWEPEDAECRWLMNFADEGADMAIHVHYLPA